MSRISSSGGCSRATVLSGDDIMLRLDKRAYLGTHLELDDLYPVRDHRRLGPLVQRRVEHRNGVRVELLGEARPLKRERHGARALEA